MRMRRYLVKRTIHMIITLLIVLVLLFMLFRLMPGTAAQNLFMRPGIGQEEKDMIAVRYGFGKLVDCPGNHFVSNFEAQVIGNYTVLVNVTDEETGMVTDFLITYFDVDAPIGEGYDFVPPEILNISAVGGNNTISLYTNATDETFVKSVKVTLTYPVFNSITAQLELESDEFSLVKMSEDSFTIDVADIIQNGTYIAEVVVSDVKKNLAIGIYKFDVMVDVGTGNVSIIDPPILKITNLGTDTTSTAIHEINEPVMFQARVGGTTTFDGNATVSTPDGTNVSVPMTAGTAGWYYGNYTPDVNGMFTFYVEADGQIISLKFPINTAVSTPPSPAQDDDDYYPILTDLAIRTEMGEYPILFTGDNTLEINITASQINGEMLSDNATVMAYITHPDGSVTRHFLQHPTYMNPTSLFEQFFIYMKTMLVFDFGNSFEDNRPVWDHILERLPPTLLLFGTASILSYTIGIFIGVAVAWRRGTNWEVGAIVVTLFFWSMPIFWSGMILQWVFFTQLDWFPIGGMGGFDVNTGTPLLGYAYVKDVLWHMALPLIALTLLHLARIVLLMRSSMLEVLGEDFITTARAKGLKQSTIVYKHAARNAMLPVVTAMALSVAGVIDGGVLTETIFSWPGMGKLLVQSTLQHNYPMVQGIFFVLAIITILLNMFVDILYAYLDPRVQL